jgi:hypothetical protein
MKVPSQMNSRLFYRILKLNLLLLRLTTNEESAA